MYYVFRPIAAVIGYSTAFTITLISICYISLHWPVFTHWECVMQVLYVVYLMSLCVPPCYLCNVIVCLTVRLCGLVVRVLGYKSGDPGFDSQHNRIIREVVGLERGKLCKCHEDN
jgi:hypothetical protein